MPMVIRRTILALELDLESSATVLLYHPTTIPFAEHFRWRDLAVLLLALVASLFGGCAPFALSDVDHCQPLPTQVLRERRFVLKPSLLQHVQHRVLPHWRCHLAFGRGPVQFCQVPTAEVVGEVGCG